MKVTKRGSAFALGVLICAGAAGCSSEDLAIPNELCKIPVSKSALSPLLPSGDELQQSYETLQSQTGATCLVKVDGKVVISATILKYEKKPEPVDWPAVAKKYGNAATRDMPFPGAGVIGSDRAIVEAHCDKGSSYMDFNIRLSGEGIDESPKGYKKLQRFVNDFVPAQTKKFGCTA
ncbi:hypothetical protein [Streptomyces sp. VRA16 Mangrove soil]|uniref:hypothetical protein n=1 Tax=Streptomyces sp. VRA16 Mangrove soil TaxID=2817434 RepID=UPI001A9EE3F1|nr:hypothetical protein [Streptomyces sp. VRA16 Mangrove soil]MBO1334126.1 hypothetical protein [Streptomyces sp. VRA16 Mangrove soil]